MGYPDLGSDFNLPIDRSIEAVSVNGNTCPLTLTRTYTYPANEIPTAYQYYPQSHFAVILHHLLSAWVEDTLLVKNELSNYIKRKDAKARKDKVYRANHRHFTISYTALFTDSPFTKMWLMSMDDKAIRDFPKRLIDDYITDGRPSNAYGWGAREAKYIHLKVPEPCLHDHASTIIPELAIKLCGCSGNPGQALDRSPKGYSRYGQWIFYSSHRGFVAAAHPG